VTPLHLAAERGVPAVMEFFLSRPDIQVNLQDEDGKTPLHQASLSGMVEAVRLLLDSPTVDSTVLNNVRFLSCFSDFVL
jgi:ankyrin repeat protein